MFSATEATVVDFKQGLVHQIQTYSFVSSFIVFSSIYIVHVYNYINKTSLYQKKMVTGILTHTKKP